VDMTIFHRAKLTNRLRVPDSSCRTRSGIQNISKPIDSRLPLHLGRFSAAMTKNGQNQIFCAAISAEWRKNTQWKKENFKR
jgi:hypothetical protein